MKRATVIIILLAAMVLAINLNGATTYISYGQGVDLRQTNLYVEYALLNVDR